MTKPDKKQRRAALREEFYERVSKSDLTLVETVKMMRKIAGRSQADYARLVGVSPRVLIEFERGISNPTLKTLQKLLAPFDLELTVRRTPVAKRETGGRRVVLVGGAHAKR